MTVTRTTGDLRSRIVAGLERSRARTLALVDGLSDDDQRAQHSPLMSPLVWDLAHIGNYEELWLLRALDGRAAVDPTLDDLYNAFEHPRWERPSLPILGPAEARAYLDRVRSDVVALLDDVALDDPALVDAALDDARDAGVGRLLDRGFVYGMVLQHEHQHGETMLATHQLMLERARRPAGATDAPRSARHVDGEVVLPGGATTLGTSDEPWAYDNERPAHTVEVAPFAIDRTPVTNGAYLDFLEHGGYERPELWTETGWAWRQEAELRAPQYWGREGGRWHVLRFGRRVPLPADEPVQHVCWYEADAYARWAGKRLPTEAEWEYAATHRPDGSRHRWPWGDDEPTGARANLGQRHDGPAPVGAYPEGASAWGVEQLVGDVWEWTSSDFAGYPGFRSFPYREYSEVFFGTTDADGQQGYKVLRGGSWAADPVAVRGTFRNWDHPIRRQIFCGFRCARDV